MRVIIPSVFVPRTDFGRYTDTFERDGYIVVYGLNYFTFKGV
jgi:hypothetical protein